jgi:hypothetical protein
MKRRAKPLVSVFSNVYPEGQKISYGRGGAVKFVLGPVLGVSDSYGGPAMRRRTMVHYPDLAPRPLPSHGGWAQEALATFVCLAEVVSRQNLCPSSALALLWFLRHA